MFSCLSGVKSNAGSLLFSPEPCSSILSTCGGNIIRAALFGFPIPEDRRTPLEIANFIAGTTSIGAHGDNFVQLAELGRFQTFPFPAKGFPPQLGKVVLTTCKPDTKKQLSTAQLAELVDNGQSILLIFGIGPHGTPKEVHGMSDIDFEVTGGNFSLETCTALGAVCGALDCKLNK